MTPSDAPAPATSGTATPGPAVTVDPERVAPGVADPTAAPLLARSILTDVHPAGAAAAWSPDGTILAFSAMPADGAHGPDVYVWRRGDATARAITRDHASYFASWSGQAIVASRIAPGAGDPSGAGNGGSAIRNVLIDPITGAERALDGDGLWLPSVGPLRRFAIAWRGEIEPMGAGVRPVAGALYLADWRSVDPRMPQADAGERAPIALQALEPDRDLTTSPVTEWQVRWSADGLDAGVWVADSVGSESGTLTVMGIDPARGVLPGPPLAGPIAARRSFTLGHDRVAYVTPTERGSLELRVATWGPGGPGTVRLGDLDSSQGAPAF